MITLRKTEKTPDEERGVWWVPANRAVADRFHALAICPDCGLMFGIHHHISPDGECSPSVVCPHEPCGFHEFVRLEGWSGGEKPNVGAARA